uniref:WD_REPEATS_REGION domain-containing protein n=1 Tax=Angiostrongylus cantonensis TaxID=6313 RepID=A0A158P7A8_ANGCA
YVIGDPDESLRITCIRIDENRSRLLVAYNNQVIREYALLGTSPALARSWKTMHTAPILCMSINADSSLLATGSADHNVKVVMSSILVWDLVQQQCTNTLKGVGVVSTISFIHNSRFLVGYMGGEVRMFDLVKGAIQKMLRDRITGFVEMPRSHLVVVVSRDQTASVIESETREVLKVFPLFEAIEAVALAQNGNLITVGEEGTVKEWLIDSARLIRSKKITGVGLDSVKFNAVRNELLITTVEENIFLVLFDKLSVRRQIVGFHDEIYSCALLDKEETHLAVSSNTKEIRLYDTRTWDCQVVEGTTCKLVPIVYATGHTSSVNAVCFSHSGKRPFLVSVSADTTIKLWSLFDFANLKDVDTTVKEIQKLGCSSTLVAHGKEVTSVDVSLSDSVCITGGLDKMVKLWHIDQVKMRLGIAGTLSGHRRGVGDVKFSPNSLKAASSSGDMTIKIWSLSERTCLQTLNGHNSAVFRILFVNNGSQLVSADSAGIIKIWSLATSEANSTLEAHTDKIWALLVNSNESEYVTAGADGSILVWGDVSDDRKREEEVKLKKHMEEEQTLNNLLEQDRLREALEYSLGLVRPFCTLKVIDRLSDREELMPALMKLDHQRLQTLLDFVTEWNTTSKTSLTSQSVLNCLLRMLPPEKFLELPNIGSILESLIPYTRRHMERLNNSRQEISLLKFTWNQMRLG